MEDTYLLFKEAYLAGLEPKYKNVAYQMFEQERPIEEIYRHISALRYPKRGTIEVTRSLNQAERKFLAALTPELRKKSFNALMQGNDFETVQRDVEQAKNIEKIKELKKETIQKAIKIVDTMVKSGVSVPMAYYEIIFDWDVLVPMDYDFFGKVALLMLSTYDKKGDGENYQKVRSFMFDKINECFDRGIMPHPLMFDFMFKGNWISEKTFMVLHIHAQELIDAGMGAKLLIPLERMLEIRRKDTDTLHPFSSREEHYFLSLINLFQKR